MTVILIYGLGLKVALDKIAAIKKSFDPLGIVQVEGKNISQQSLAEILTPSLFTEKRLVILEEIDEKFDLLGLSDDPNLTLIIKISKNLTATSSLLNQAKKLNAQIIQTTEEKETSIFPFLDMLAEKNPRALIEQEKLIKEFGGQYILTMLFYMLRRFILPGRNMPSFVAQKMNMQKQNFPLGKIKDFYKEVLEADFKIKQGFISEEIAIRGLTNSFLNS